MTDAQKATCRKILKHYGIKNQQRQLVEECAELIQALAKMERTDAGANRRHNLAAEIADVEIMLEQIKYYYFAGRVSEMIDYKLNRQLDRIAKEGGEQ